MSRYSFLFSQVFARSTSSAPESAGGPGGRTGGGWELRVRDAGPVFAGEAIRTDPADSSTPVVATGPIHAPGDAQTGLIDEADVMRRTGSTFSPASVGTAGFLVARGKHTLPVDAGFPTGAGTIRDTGLAVLIGIANAISTPRHPHTGTVDALLMFPAGSTTGPTPVVPAGFVVTGGVHAGIHQTLVSAVAGAVQKAGAAMFPPFGLAQPVSTARAAVFRAGGAVVVIVADAVATPGNHHAPPLETIVMVRAFPAESTASVPAAFPQAAVGLTILTHSV